ncbi:MAG TPA: AI-2E family transporter [Deltaproteobacteria bacterium]|nr:AI-2E family transporter [Deltaproteobacteria bacterium]HPJ93428.1 AI-2E family transporter [Deltaproteobacteria bacterium]HPR51731.1 AI-2E family transporter [Deltaproteobacteria bacterium]
MKKYIQNWFKRYFSNPQVLILVFLLFVGFVLIAFLGDMLLPVLVAIVIAYLLDGIVMWLEHFRIPRGASVVIVFLLFIALLAVLIVVLLPLISRQIGQFVQELPSMVAKGQMELMRLPDKYPGFISQERIRQMLMLIGSEFTQLGQHILSISMSSVKGLISVLVYLILVPFLVFFFLKDKAMIFAWIKNLLPRERGLAKVVWNEVNQQISNYIRGKIWEIIIVWGVSYLTFTFIGLRFTIILSLFVGLSVLIPYIGAAVMVLPISLIAFFQWGPSAHFLYTVIAYGIIQALDGNLLAPLLLSEVVNLHPVAIIVAVLVFGGIWGIWGLVFAIPLATLVHAVFKAWTSSLSSQMNHPEAV